jgi:hypothetical protein
MKVYNIFIDEAGMTPYFSDKDQPVLCLAGVLSVRDDTKFKKHAEALFTKYKIDYNEVFHAYPLIKGMPPFENLNQTEREKLYLEFIQMGIKETAHVYVRRQFKKDIRDPMIKTINIDMNLDPYLYTLMLFLTDLDRYFIDKFKNYTYRLYFHKSDNFNKQTKRMVEELCKPSDEYHMLQKITDEPRQLKSNENRFIQLADAIAFVMTKYYQFDMEKVYKVPDNIKKYRSFVMRCYNMLENKLLDITQIENYWKLLNPKELRGRDFKHKRNWTAKKRKPDRYDGSDKIIKNIYTKRRHKE